MYNIKLIQSGLDDLNRITKADFFLCDAEGEAIASTFDKLDIDNDIIVSFASGAAESQNIGGYHYLKISGSNDDTYVLITFSLGADGYTTSRIAASEVTHLMAIESDRNGKEEFYKDILYDKVLLGEIKSRSSRLRINPNITRQVFAIHVPEDVRDMSKEIVANVFSEDGDDYVTSVADNIIILIKAIHNEEEELAEDNANQIVSTMNTELMIRARVTYGRKVDNLKELSESFKEASMAMEVMRIFYDEKVVASYDSLGIGRLIHQLPKQLCDMFLQEVFGDSKEPGLTEEESKLIGKLFDNNLNVAETARALGLKRTTLIYRLDKLGAKLGLDLCCFEDAITLKIAMMVAKYTEFIKKNDYF